MVPSSGGTLVYDQLVNKMAQTFRVLEISSMQLNNAAIGCYFSACKLPKLESSISVFNHFKRTYYTGFKMYV